MSPFQVKRSAFQTKLSILLKLKLKQKFLALAKNSFGIVENQSSLSEENFEPTLSDADFNIK
jgi:electron transfer flavoprotein alpha subunit